MKIHRYILLRSESEGRALIERIDQARGTDHWAEPNINPFDGRHSFHGMMSTWPSSLTLSTAWRLLLLTKLKTKAGPLVTSPAVSQGACQAGRSPAHQSHPRLIRSQSKLPSLPGIVFWPAFVSLWCQGSSQTVEQEAWKRSSGLVGCQV